MATTVQRLLAKPVAKPTDYPDGKGATGKHIIKLTLADKTLYYAALKERVAYPLVRFPKGRGKNKIAILRIHPDADAPVPEKALYKRGRSTKKTKGIPIDTLLQIAKAYQTELNKALSSGRKRLDEEIRSVVAQIKSANDMDEILKLNDQLLTLKARRENWEHEAKLSALRGLATKPEYESIGKYVGDYVRA